MLRSLLPPRFRATPQESLRHRGRTRVAMYLVSLTAASTAFALHSAHAEVARHTMALGRDLAPLADLLKERAQVNINGERIWASSGVSKDNVHDVLNRFEANCRENGVTEHMWGNSFPKDPTLKLGVFRAEEKDEGAVICFPQPAGKVAAFRERLASFLTTTDLGELGQLRYAYVRFERGQSHVSTAWTEGQFRFDRIAPTDGSEPGSDNPDLPRPVRSRRTVSAAIEGTPYGALGYMSTASPNEVHESFATDMKARGWLMTKTMDDSVRGYMKNGSMVTIGTKINDRGTLVGIGQMGVDPTP